MMAPKPVPIVWFWLKYHRNFEFLIAPRYSFALKLAKFLIISVFSLKLFDHLSHLMKFDQNIMPATTKTISRLIGYK